MLSTSSSRTGSSTACRRWTSPSMTPTARGSSMPMPPAASRSIRARWSGYCAGRLLCSRSGPARSVFLSGRAAGGAGLVAIRYFLDTLKLAGNRLSWLESLLSPGKILDDSGLQDRFRSSRQAARRAFRLTRGFLRGALGGLMVGTARERSISLDRLDDHLKAILKLKLREFVHLSPWFHNNPSLDVTYYPRPAPAGPAAYPPRRASAAPGAAPRRPQPEPCPHRAHRSISHRKPPHWKSGARLGSAEIEKQ